MSVLTFILVELRMIWHYGQWRSDGMDGWLLHLVSGPPLVWGHKREKVILNLRGPDPRK